ncbi:ATP-binding protein [Nonomuraea lactucae]|uniref:ATP-binding protein n=1 Tax=Nonomuraea lactucae TaxID=2249762 RepID=UPI000DE33544|nr:ATP-binding protein [Nonomuraea lactucae]
MNTDPGDADPPPLLDMPFDEGSLAATRGEVQRRAHEQGLAGERLGDFVMAVNECLVNVVAHAGGRGRLRLGHEGTGLFCEITDSGPGIPARYLDEADLPAPSELGGRGIWLIRRLTDGAAFATGPAGTTVLMVMKLPRDGEPPFRPGGGGPAVPTGRGQA